MRAVHAIPVVLTAWLLAGCGAEPSGSDNANPPLGGSGGFAGSTGAAGTAAGVGGMPPAPGTSGTGGIAGMIGMAGTSATGMGGMNGAAGMAGMEAGTGGMDGVSGSGGMGGEGGGPAPMGSYFPLKTGNSWTFRVTEAGVMSMKTQTIGPLEMVGGSGPNATKMAYRAETTKDNGGDMTVSWQAEVDGKIVRYREQSFMAAGGALELEEHWEPYKLRVDATEARLMNGAMWTENYSETKLPVGMAPSTAPRSDMWRVISVSESVTVPAGTFDALVIEKTGSMPKRYWFVRGIGKVKETGTQTEELVSYEVME